MLSKRMAMKTWIVFVLVMLSLVAESTSFDMEKRIVSFNAELYRGYCNELVDKDCKEFDQRLVDVANAIPKYLGNSDVVCLQGIYNDDEVEKILQTSGTFFPFSYSFNHDENGNYKKKTNEKPPCVKKDLPYVREVVECEMDSCHSEAENNDFIACVEKTCSVNRTTSIRDVFAMLTDTCLSCIFEGTYRNAYDCFNVDYAINPTGLLLLSRSPILSYNRDFFTDDKESIRHGYLETDIENLGPVFCTMMQPYIGKDYIDIDKEEGSSYEKKNKEEASVLAAITKKYDNVVIAGCLNTSPFLTKGSIKPQFEGSINIFKSAGFVDPISASYEGSYASCTFCFNNKYVKDKYKEKNSDGYIFDHVLVKGFTVDNWELKNGVNKNIYRVLLPRTDTDSDLPLSAHYGVSVQILVSTDEITTPSGGSET